MSKIKILITDGMAENGLKLLNENSSFEIDVRKSTSKEELEKVIGEYQVIVIRSATQLTENLIQKAIQMKLIVRAGAGVDNIDVPVATGKKIPVMNTATANSLAAAEQTIALMFSLLRHIPQSSRSLSEGKWDRGSFKGFELTGKTLGIIGLGNIGRIVAQKAIGLGMQVLGFDPTIQSLDRFPELAKHAESLSLAKSLADLLPKVDLLSIHVPKTETTTNLINSTIIEQMRDKSFLINCARGGIVNEKDVLSAVDSGKLEGAAFDVYEKEPPEFSNPLFNHPKIVAVPHLGAATFEAQKRVASTAASQIIGFFTKEDHTGVINGL